MVKKILKKIASTEQKKEQKVKAQAELQQEIEGLDLNLKKLNAFKKDYEKLQKNFDDFINNP